MKVVTVEQMRTLEQAADAQGLAYATMMENAGRAVANWLEAEGIADKRILVLVGPGNNGGDGLVAARYLHQAGADVTVYCWQRDVQADENWRLVLAAGIPTLWSQEDERLAKLRRLASHADWIVDSLLGTGSSRPITGALQQMLAVVRKELDKRRGAAKPEQTMLLVPSRPGPRPESSPRVLAVDVPSGLNCDTGAVDPATLPADVTVTFAFPKVGQFLFPGAALLGDLVVADIGIPAKLSRDISLEVGTPDQVRSLLPARPLDGHKGTFGKAMVVAGSANYTGAPYLAACAALRVGAGLVTLGIPESLQPIVATKLTEATYLLLPHEMGALIPEGVKVLQERLADYDSLLLGPGLGRDEKTIAFVQRLLNLPLDERKARLGFVGAPSTVTEEATQPLPLVVDADGLHALSCTKSWAKSLQRPTVLTPHPGEMARLLDTSVRQVEADRMSVARRAASDWGVVVVLKGAYTIIAGPDGSACVNPFASPVLATAGTGDVLAGAIVGLLAQGLSPFDAAVAGAYVHGLAGQMVGDEVGAAGAVAGDLLPKLPLSVRRVAAA